MTVATLPGVIFATLMIISLVASAIVIIRSSLMRTRLEALQGDRDDLTSRLEELRKEYKECKDRCEILQVRMDTEVSRREALEKVVTGKRELELVLQILTQHDERAEKVQRMVRQLLDLVERRS